MASLGIALGLDAASFALAALAVIKIDVPEAATAESALRSSLLGTLGLLRCGGRLRSLLAIESAANVFFAVIIPFELVFVTETLAGSMAAFGVVLTAWASAPRPAASCSSGFARSTVACSSQRRSR